MKKWVIALLLLFVAVTAYAADFTVVLTQGEYDLLTRAALWTGKTRQSIVREAIVNRLNYEKEIRKQQVTFTNDSAICTLYDCR